MFTFPTKLEPWTATFDVYAVICNNIYVALTALNLTTGDRTIGVFTIGSDLLESTSRLAEFLHRLFKLLESIGSSAESDKMTGVIEVIESFIIPIGGFL